MSATAKLREALLKLSCNNMLGAAAKRDGLDHEQACRKVEELLTPLKKFLESLPQNETAGLMLYREHIGEQMWEVMGTNPAIYDFARNYVTSLVGPEMQKAFELFKTWINDPEFTKAHFALLFE